MTTHDDFGLARPKFHLDPLTDTDCFARADVHPGELSRTLEIDLATSVSPKRIIYGQYGAGKTHTLNATVRILGEHLQVRTVNVECPDLGRNSSFIDFYRDGIMRAMGQSAVVGLFRRFVQSKPPKAFADMLSDLTAELRDEALAAAVMRLYNPAFTDLAFWAWISGVSVKGGDLKELGQTQDLTGAEPAMLANVLIVIGELLQRLDGHSLVLILDELERLRPVGPEGMQTFRTAFTRLVDPSQQTVCILFGVSANQLRDSIDLFVENSPVMSRLGHEAEIQIPPMPIGQVESFMSKVIAYIRIPTFSASVAAADAATAYGEPFSEGFFPFSNEAVDKIKLQLGQNITPREIMRKMTRSLGQAMLADRKAIIVQDVE